MNLKGNRESFCPLGGEGNGATCPEKFSGWPWIFPSRHSYTGYLLRKCSGVEADIPHRIPHRIPPAPPPPPRQDQRGATCAGSRPHELGCAAGIGEVGKAAAGRSCCAGMWLSLGMPELLGFFPQGNQDFKVNTQNFKNSNIFTTQCGSNTARGWTVLCDLFVPKAS